MPFIMNWNCKTTGENFSGPILGEVTNFTFIPLSKEQAENRLTYFNKHYKNADHTLQEVPFLQSDLSTLEKLHPYFSSAVDLRPSALADDSILPAVNERVDESWEDVEKRMKSQLDRHFRGKA